MSCDGEREGEEEEEEGEKEEEGERVQPDEDILLQHCLLSLAPWYYYNDYNYYNHIIFKTPVSYNRFFTFQ